MLSYVICHFIAKQATTIGNNSKNTIQLNGIGILEKHAIINNNSNKNEITIEPATVGVQVKVNGIELVGPKVLDHKDRVLFGKLKSDACNQSNIKS